jgi:hypothetical protein
MKALKILAAIILSIIILAVQSSALAVKALSDSLTAQAISDAIRSSASAKSSVNIRLKAPVLTLQLGLLGVSYDDDYTDILTEADIAEIGEALGQGDISGAISKIIRDKAEELGIEAEKAEALTKTILSNEAVISYVGEYSSQLINSTLNGEAAPVISTEKVMELAASVIEELPEDLKEGLDVQLVRSSIEKIAPDLAENLNTTVSSAQKSMETVGIRQGALRAAGYAVNGKLFRYLLGADIVLGGLLILLFLKSKKGLIWWAVTSLITAIPFILLKWTAAAAVAALPRFKNYAGLVKPFLTRCQTYGLILLGFAVLLIIVYLLLTKLNKHTADIAAEL